MGRNTLLRSIATYITTVTMTLFGFTSMAAAQTITNTGPGSTNNINTTTTNNCSRVNNNAISASNSNTQNATSGSANVSGNTTAGWSGWSALDPTAAQAAGISYASWWGAVVNWIGTHAGGAGWNSTETNLTWTPGSANWSGINPVSWQVNGQSFSNWYNAAQSYLNSNSSVWVLGWPADATGTMALGGASSGSATNNYNANFSININNTARKVAGTDSCGRSLFVPPTPTQYGGGSGGGVVMGASVVSRSQPHTLGASGGVGGGGFYIPTSHTTGSAPHTSNSSGNVPSQPVSVNPAVVPPSTQFSNPPTGNTGSISNTGPGSTNSINSTYTNNSTVTNNNNVSTGSFSTQTATSGSSNVSNNTSVGGAGTGTAQNNNDTSGDVSVSN